MGLESKKIAAQKIRKVQDLFSRSQSIRPINNLHVFVKSVKGLIFLVIADSSGSIPTCMALDRMFS